MTVLDRLTGTAGVRDFVRTHMVEEARRAGAARFRVNAGEVHRALRLHNRIPVVCSALRSKKFLDENGLRIVEILGPPSGLSTSVTVTYEFVDHTEVAPDDEGWQALRGIARDVFASLGGGEQFIRSERDAFFSPDSLDKRK